MLYVNGGKNYVAHLLPQNNFNAGLYFFKKGCS